MAIDRELKQVGPTVMAGSVKRLAGPARLLEVKLGDQLTLVRVKPANQRVDSTSRNSMVPPMRSVGIADAIEAASSKSAHSIR